MKGSYVPIQDAAKDDPQLSNEKGCTVRDCFLRLFSDSFHLKNENEAFPIFDKKNSKDLWVKDNIMCSGNTVLTLGLFSLTGRFTLSVVPSVRRHVFWQIDMEACVLLFIQGKYTSSSTVAHVTHDWLTWRISVDGIQYSCWVTVWGALSSTCCSSFDLSSQLFSHCFKYNHIYSTR